MTDAEKMLEMMATLGMAAKEETKTQCDSLANMMKIQYDSFVKVGFSPKMAFDMVKTILASAMQAGMKK